MLTAYQNHLFKNHPTVNNTQISIEIIISIIQDLFKHVTILCIRRICPDHYRNICGTLKPPDGSWWYQYIPHKSILKKTIWKRNVNRISTNTSLWNNFNVNALSSSDSQKCQGCRRHCMNNYGQERVNPVQLYLHVIASYRFRLSPTSTVDSHILLALWSRQVPQEKKTGRKIVWFKLL